MANYNKRWAEYEETGNFLHSRVKTDVPLGEMLGNSFKVKCILVILPVCLPLEMNLCSHKTCMFIETLFIIAHN